MKHWIILFTALLATGTASAVLFVDSSSAVDGSGVSWAAPHISLQEAIDHAYAHGGEDLWVRKGTYAEAIELRPSVAVYGGFKGNEHLLTQRNPWVYVTTIDVSGLAAPVHAVVGADNAVLDGFTITGGSASSGSTNNGGGIFIDGVAPLIANCVLRGNTASWSGGGAFVNAGSPSFLKCIFLDNTGGNEGGGLLIGNCQAGDVEVVNCVFSGNSAYYGGGLCCKNSNPLITGCTFQGNSATWGGAFFNGAIFYTGQARLYNSILWDNLPEEISTINWTGAMPLVRYSDVKGGWGGTGNIDADPLFVSAPARNYRLQFGSPCINTATATNAPADDILGVARPVGSGYDMGAYEYTGLSIVINVKPAIGRVPLDVKTVNKSTQAPDGAKWIWDFGDGTRREGVSPSHTYKKSGLYTISVTVETGKEVYTETRPNLVIVLNRKGMCPVSWLFQWLLSSR